MITERKQRSALFKDICITMTASFTPLRMRCAASRQLKNAEWKRAGYNSSQSAAFAVHLGTAPVAHGI